MWAAEIWVRIRAAPLGTYGVGEAYDVDAFFEEPFGHLLREDGVAEHDRDDGVLAGDHVQSEFDDALSEIAGVLCELVAQFCRSGEYLKYLE